MYDQSTILFKKIDVICHVYYFAKITIYIYSRATYLQKEAYENRTRVRVFCKSYRILMNYICSIN